MTREGSQRARPAATAARLGLTAAVLAATAALAVLVALAADWRSPPPGEGPESIRVRRIEDLRYVPVNDLARLLDAAKFWRADVRKLVLRAGAHTIVLTVDNPFAIVDEGTIWMGAPVRSVDGELHVPVTLADLLPRDSTIARLTYDDRRERVVVLPPSGRVGTPRLAFQGDVTRLVFPAEKPDEAVVVTRARDRFRIRLGGVFVGTLPDSFPAAALIRDIRQIASAGGSAFEARVDTAAAGYRLVQDVRQRRVALEIARRPHQGFDAFAPEVPPGERRLETVVIDPAHGGRDAGVRAGSAVEKDLTLALAHLLRAELDRQRIRAVLTRSDDRDLTADARAELANRVGADLVLTLHFDGYVDPRARGATAYCPPATVAGGPEAAGGDPAGPSRIVLLRWRDVATRHAVQSRALAEAVLSALELRGQGPTRLRERLTYGLLGVNAPGILLESATLTSPDDRDRALQEEGLRQLAVSIADGIAAYRRGQ